MTNTKEEKLREDGLAHEVPYRFDLIDADAITAMANVMAEGTTTHKEEGWRKMNENDIINHALGHVFSHLAGDRSIDHLAHAMCRVMMGWAVHNKGVKEWAKSIKMDALQGVQERENATARRRVEGMLNTNADSVFFAPKPPVIYLCYPYRDNPVKRTESAKAIGRSLQEEFPHCLILIPHIMFQFLSEEKDRATIMSMCKAAVGLADIVVVASTPPYSEGMSEEIVEANRLKKRIMNWHSVLNHEVIG